MAKILIVEDNEPLRESVERLLTQAGHKVMGKATGEEALADIDAFGPDLVVLDVMLPGIDGWTVLERIRPKLPQPGRVVMLTGEKREQDYLKGWKLGVGDYLSKPCKPEDLRKSVEETLAATREEIERRQRDELEKADLLRRIESAFGLD